MIQRIRWLMLLQILGFGIICLANRPRQLLRKSLLFPERPQNGLMQQKPNILGIIKGGIRSRPLVSFFLIPRFAWIDALEYTKATKIGERDLKEFERLIAGYVGLCSAFLAFLFDPHFGEKGDGRSLMLIKICGNFLRFGKAGEVVQKCWV